MIARIDPFVAARHALATGGQHLARVLFPDFESIEFFFERERTILDQCVRRRVMRLRMFNSVDLGTCSARHGRLLETLILQPKSKRRTPGSGSVLRRAGCDMV